MREPVFSFFFFFTFTRSFDLSTSLLEFRFISHAQMRNFRFCEIFTEIAFTTSCPSSPRNILFVVGWNYFYIITRFVQNCLLWQIIAEMNDALFFLSISIKQNCSGCVRGVMQISIEFINDTIRYYVTFHHVPSYLISDTESYRIDEEISSIIINMLL